MTGFAPADDAAHIGRGEARCSPRTTFGWKRIGASIRAADADQEG
jgi:hypothetical protein